jgi:hypothetical protein
MKEDYFALSFSAGNSHPGEIPCGSGPLGGRLLSIIQKSRIIETAAESKSIKFFTEVSV